MSFQCRRTESGAGGSGSETPSPARQGMRRGHGKLNAAPCSWSILAAVKQASGTPAPAWHPVVVLIIVTAAAPSAGFSDCIEECIKTPAAQGHFECCTNPLVSSFNKPSCATGCHMAEYSQNLEECNSWCEKASVEGHPCQFQVPGIPGKEGSINMCGSCDCGLHDCPGHPAPEPEQCKDPAHGGPDGGDCGWVNRCRGSLEGCKHGCKLQQSAGRSGWGFALVLCFCAAGYVGVGIGLRVKRNGAPLALASHPHYRQWVELGGLVADGVQMTQTKLTGRTMPKPSRSSAGYSALSTGSSTGGASPPSSKGTKHKSERKASKEEKQKSKKKGHNNSRDDRAAAPDGAPVGTDEATSMLATNLGPTASGAESVKGTASAGGGRWVHVPA